MNKSIEFNWRERAAYRIMMNLKYDKEDRIYKFYICWRNDIIMTVAKLLLRRNPIKFFIDLMELDEEEAYNSGLTNL